MLFPASEQRLQKGSAVCSPTGRMCAALCVHITHCSPGRTDREAGETNLVGLFTSLGRVIRSGSSSLKKNEGVLLFLRTGSWARKGKEKHGRQEKAAHSSAAAGEHLRGYDTAAGTSWWRTDGRIRLGWWGGDVLSPCCRGRPPGMRPHLLTSPGTCYMAHWTSRGPVSAQPLDFLEVSASMPEGNEA